MMKIRHKKVKIGVLFLILLGLTNVNAQHTTIPAGGDASGNGGTVAYSIGQVVYTTNTGAGGSVNQGVQQVYEIISVGTKHTSINISMYVYPNPTTNNLTLEVEEYSNKNLIYQVFDIQGRLLESNQITNSHTQINAAGLPAAIYFLKIIHENKMLQTFKFIKK